MTLIRTPTELKDDVKYDTLELLLDPEVLKQNLELQLAVIFVVATGLAHACVT